MPAENDEIQRRQAAALSAIKAAYGTEDDEEDATLFVSHHLEELDASYWEKHLGEASPEPVRVLDLLVLRSHWGYDGDDDDGIDIFDFTLPDGVTDYVISVAFDEDGEVESVLMEG